MLINAWLRTIKTWRRVFGLSALSISTSIQNLQLDLQLKMSIASLQVIKFH